MSFNRRSVLKAFATSTLLSTSGGQALTRMTGCLESPTFSVTPVVFDGEWIWEKQPEDQKGLLDGRVFELEVGIRWRSDGEVRNLRSSTVAPVEFPEQKVLDFRIGASPGCSARVVPLTGTVGQLQVIADRMERGQKIEAKAVYRLLVSRFCPHFKPDQFPRKQSYDRKIQKQGLGNSPGIQWDLDGIRSVVVSLISDHDSPWSKAHKFYEWVWQSIEGRRGSYTSVQEALSQRVGDCEERAAVFIALCRAVNIPARLVWVPGHCWAEFCLNDWNGSIHWIPAHTAAYRWFGWTGAHEIVFQKGDRIFMPGKDSTVRLISDWYSFDGRRPSIEFFGEIKPVSLSGDDPGPGHRRKNRRSGWDLVGEHPAKSRIRDG
jgi:hypothetical protein